MPSCLFLIQALVNRAVNKLETIHAQRRELSQNLFSLLEIYQISDKENKSVSSVYVYVLVYSFVGCVFVGFNGDKSREKSDCTATFWKNPYLCAVLLHQTTKSTTI